MPEICVHCGQVTLYPKTVELPGTVRGERYVVEMPGYACSNCGHKTIDGTKTAEYSRLLADKWRSAHGYLTSEQIKERRLKLELSQQSFADFLQRSPASVKRWEWGKIQEPDNDRRIREMTDPKPANTGLYILSFNSAACNANTLPDGNVFYAGGTSQRPSGGAFAWRIIDTNQGSTTSAGKAVDLPHRRSTASRISERLIHARD
jgi:putative zinc finger/helix-turn-helix YgiT family protein